MAKRSLFDSLKAFFSGEPAAADPVPGAPPPADIWADPEPQDDWRDRIPQSAHDKVLLIRDTIHQLEKECAERAMQTELDELGRIKGTHLPKLLQSYIEIPPEHRAEVFRETGKSASFLLLDSLDKMLARLREISAQLARGNITTFAENVRFVDLYYEQNKGPFD